MYDYRRDDKRQNDAANVLPDARSGGPGTLADGSGTGWNTLALKGTWRPSGPTGTHVVDFGVQQERYRLRYRTSNVAGNYLSDPVGSAEQQRRGPHRLQSAYAQDVWRLARALEGGPRRPLRALGRVRRPHRLLGGEFAAAIRPGSESFFSPKAALSWQWRDDTVLKASLGRAVRMPTVGELYGATSTTNAQFINDPNLRPERSWTGELSAERDLGVGSARLTAFAEDTHDSLYSQTIWTRSPTGTSAGSRTSRASRRPASRRPCDEQDWLAPGPRPRGERHLHRFEDQGQRRLRRGAGRHDRQMATQHPALAGDGARQLSLRSAMEREHRRALQRPTIPARSTTPTSTATPTWGSASS